MSDHTRGAAASLTIGPMEETVALLTATGCGIGAAAGLRINNLLPGFIDSLPERAACAVLPLS